MAQNYGKAFEKKFWEDWQSSFPFSFIYRLHDQVTGYKETSKNPCDFVAYDYPLFFMIECKSTKGNTFNFGKLRQFDLMKSYIGIKGLYAGVVIWFIDHYKVCWVPIEEVKRLKAEGYKSINVSMIDDEKYKVCSLPSAKKRIFLDTNYHKIYDMGTEELYNN